MSAQGPLSAPQGCSVSPDNRAALHATASCFAALHATASCFAIGYRDGIASPRPTACLEFPIKIGNTSPLACSLQELFLPQRLLPATRRAQWALHITSTRSFLLPLSQPTAAELLQPQLLSARNGADRGQRGDTAPQQGDIPNLR
jgi:hypothetical protein